LHGSRLAEFDTLTSLHQLDALSLFGECLPDDGLQIISRLPQLRSLDLSGKKQPDEARLAGLRDCHNIRELNLQGMGLTDNVVDYIAPLVDLEGLNLAGNQITEVGLARLKGLTNLRTLECPDSNGLSDKLLEALQPNEKLRQLACGDLGRRGVDALKLFPGLRNLAIGAYKPSGDSLDLTSFSNLRSIQLAPQTVPVQLPADVEHLRIYQGDIGVKISLEGSRRLKSIEVECDRLADSAGKVLSVTSLPAVRSLTLIAPTDRFIHSLGGVQSVKELKILNSTPCGFSDEGMTVFDSLPHLEQLTLDATFVTDRGIGHLEKCTSMRRLDLIGIENVTEEGLSPVWRMKNLEALRLDMSRKIDLGGIVEKAAALSDLREISIGGIMSDAAIMRLTRLKNLRKLDLSRNEGFTDKALVLNQASFPRFVG
jgi:Leucine-rich repeat (LRR) protein